MHSSSEPRVMAAPSSSVPRSPRFEFAACVLACSLSMVNGFSPQSQLLAFSPVRLVVSSQRVAGLPPPWKRKITNPLDSLKPGMRLPGVVRNIEPFGAFIDVGAERDGFIHISDISTEFVHSPRDLLQPGKEVQAWIKYVDLGAKKLQLTLVEHKVDAEAVGKLNIEKFATIIGEEVEGVITRITNYGAYVDIGCEAEAWLHSTELPKPKGAPKRMILDDLIVGRPMKVRILEVDIFQNRVKVTGRSKDDVEKKRIFGAPPEDKRSVFVRGPRPPSDN